MYSVIWLVCLAGTAVHASYDDEEAAKNLLDELEAKNRDIVNSYWNAAWNYGSNLTKHNLELKLNISAELAKREKMDWEELMKYNWREFKDPDLKRKYMLASDLGESILPDDDFKKYSEIVAEMSDIYGKAKVCDYKNKSKCDLSLEPELTKILISSRDPEELAYYWKAWRDASGKKMRQYYKDYVDYSNQIAKLNNFTDAAAHSLDDFEEDSFEADLESLWKNMEPLYKDLHAYVRGRLNEYYGDKVVPKKEPIPAQLLGNMWSQSWTNILDLTMPYPTKHSVDVTNEMIKQGYTPMKMFKAAEDFFVSLNLSAMPPLFWENSIIEKPKDGRDLICHASAWDFYDGKDFRIKMCTTVTQNEFEVIHHEMGHVQYFIQYKDQPRIYRRGANSGFHEAIGDVISMSVSTPKHLKRIGLLPEDFELDKESSINSLFHAAMEKVAAFPFLFLLDQWRWDVYRGKSTEADYNCHYWKLRTKYQGIQPPVKRTEEDFDPGAKYHIAADVPYVRYFVSTILQFQFHKSLCLAAGQFDPKNPESTPLFNCDIYKSKEAGEKFGAMLKLGSSKPWPDALEILTGSRKMSTDDLVDYFKPLQDWLQKENKAKGYEVGWETPDYCNKQS